MEDEDLTKIPHIYIENENFFPNNFPHLNGKF